MIPRLHARARTTLDGGSAERRGRGVSRRGRARRTGRGAGERRVGARLRSRECLPSQRAGREARPWIDRVSDACVADSWQPNFLHRHQNNRGRPAIHGEGVGRPRGRESLRRASRASAQKRKGCARDRTGGSAPAQRARGGQQLLGGGRRLRHRRKRLCGQAPGRAEEAAVGRQPRNGGDRSTEPLPCSILPSRALPTPLACR